MILLLLLVFIRYYIGRGRLLFCPCSGCQAASLTELGVGYAWENSPLRLVRHCGHCACAARRRREVQLFCSDEGCGAEASPLQPEHQGRPPADPEVQRRLDPGIPYIQQTLEKAV